MIVATVGTHGQPFPRFVDLVRELPADEVLLQYGPGPEPEGFERAVDFLPFGELMARMREASAVVTHAGVGSVLCARNAGHLPIVVPRLRALGEHVDDHQAEFTRRLEARGDVVAVWGESGLAQAVGQAAQRRDAFPPGGDGRLQRAVRAALLGAHA